MERKLSGRVKRITYAGMVTVIIAGIGAYAQTDSSAMTLGELFTYARDNNPELKALQHAVDAKKHDVILATTLPDPTLSAGYFITPVETRVGPQKGKVGASQMIPWPGKLMNKKRIAENELSAETEKLQDATVVMLSDITGIYAELYALGKTISIDSENLQLLQHMESVLLARYAADEASQMSLLKIQVEMSVLEDEIKSLRADAAKQKELMKSVLGDSSGQLAFPQRLPSMTVALKESDLDSMLDAASPKLKYLSFTRMAADEKVRLSRKAFLPDFMLMTDYIITGKSSSSMVAADENGKDPWVVGASVTLPVWFRSKNATIGKMKSMEMMTAEKEKNMRNMLRAKIIELHESYKDVERKISLFETVLIPKAQQSLALFEEAYANSKATVLDFLDAQRMLLDLEIKLARQEAMKIKLTGKMDMILGGNELLALENN